MNKQVSAFESARNLISQNEGESLKKSHSSAKTAKISSFRLAVVNKPGCKKGHGAQSSGKWQRSFTNIIP